MSGPLRLEFVTSATRASTLPESPAEVAFVGRSGQLLDRLLTEAGFDVLEQFTSRSGTTSEGETGALTPRILFVGVDSPKLFGGFGKNWSTYYRVASIADRFAIFGSEALGVYNAGTDGGATGTGRATA